MQHPRQVLTRATIFERVWGYDFGYASNSLDVYIGYLRRKTEAGGEPRLIHTEAGDRLRAAGAVSFRLRLTMSVAAAVALAVAVACAIAYIVVGQQLYGQIDSSLRDEAAVAVQWTLRPASAPAREARSRAPTSTTGRSSRADGASGQPRTSPACELPVTQAALDAAQRRDSRSSSARHDRAAASTCAWRRCRSAPASRCRSPAASPTPTSSSRSCGSGSCWSPPAASRWPRCWARSSPARRCGRCGG